MTSMTEITCKCGCERKKMVRTADVKRGWGLFFSKKCKAKKQAKGCGGRKYGVQTLINAHQSGKISDDYLIWKARQEYPLSARRIKQETGIDIDDFRDEDYQEHPHSSEGLGQWL